MALEAAGQLTITTSSLANGTQNVAYSATLAAGGGTLPYTWSLAGGSLPTGLTLSEHRGYLRDTDGSRDVQLYRPGDRCRHSRADRHQGLEHHHRCAGDELYHLARHDGPRDSWTRGPDSAVELGVKFRSDVAGTITGIRFYKASTNTGTHVGNLWSSTGTLLATATFANETASGWQQVNFSTPVAITANTVYVASYHTNVGHYSDNLNYFASQGVDSPPLARPGQWGVRRQRGVSLRLEQRLPQPGME